MGIIVIQSHKNWEEHKKQVHEFFVKKIGEKRSKQFIEFYADRYDRHGRSFIHYKLALSLLDDFFTVKQTGTKWWACVGVGCTGKSTLMKNVFNFFDPTMTLEKTNTTLKEFVQTLQHYPKGSMKACFMDEPDNTIWPTSPDGIKLRSIVGKMRQHTLFCGICATVLSDIPRFIWKKVDYVFYCPKLGEVWYFKNNTKRQLFPIPDMRENYNKFQYNLFPIVRKKYGCLMVRTHKTTAYEHEMARYEEEKWNDYVKDLNGFTAVKVDRRLKVKSLYSEELKASVEKLQKEGLSHVLIAKSLGLSRVRITQIINENKRAEGNTKEVYDIITQR